ncbi:MAG: hypothetical protein ABIO16_14805, partial [Nocardioides sp.]
MTTTARHPLVEDYLARLHAEAGRLPDDQARELVADIDEHLAAAIPQDATEADVRNVLERLGAPSDLVNEAGGTVPAEKGKTFASPVGAIVCLLAAEVLSLLLPVSIPLWIIGLVMMARTEVWSERDKWLGFIGLGSGFPVAFVFLAVATLTVRPCGQVYENGVLVQDTCGGTNWVAITAWTVTLGYLALQALTVWRLVRSA